MNRVEGDRSLDSEERQSAISFYREASFSRICQSDDPEWSELRSDACPTWSDAWQFHIARKTSLFTLGLGWFAFLISVVLGFATWIFPRYQYPIFLTGWFGLLGIAAMEVVLQTSLLLWLSYWGTALLFSFYSVKIIGLAAFFGAIAVWTALYTMFRKLNENSHVEGEVLQKERSPALWERIEKLAQKVQTGVPSAIVGGIDSNFFVTEAPIDVQGEKITGRTLYVSLPLLRLCSLSEADAILAHELAHFKGNDTRLSAKLGPAIQRFDVYSNSLAQTGMGLPAFGLMNCFRVIFEFAHKKESRRREFLADKVASEVTSGDDVAKSLLKVTAYSLHRNEVLQTLFQGASAHTHETLSLRARMSEGLAAFVSTNEFPALLSQSQTPHPFDSHPPLQERIAAVAPSYELARATDEFTRSPEKTWADLIADSSDIENRQWEQLQSEFAQSHERDLAFRYVPGNAEERALVEKYYPQAKFSLKEGGEWVLECDTLFLDDESVFKLARIKSPKINEENFTHQFLFAYEEEDGSLQNVKLNLRKLGARPLQDTFKNQLVAYWQRAQSAEQYQASQAALPSVAVGAAEV